MPRPMRGNPGEKSKDFKGSMLRLFKSLDTWRILLVFALILACISAVFSIISPNILSSLTDEITNGLKPNTKQIENITLNITEQLNKTNIQNKSEIIFYDENISYEDKLILSDALEKMAYIQKEEEALGLLLTIPDNILNKFFEDFKIDDILVSSKDQVVFIRTMSSINMEDANDSFVKIEGLPSNIYELVKPSIDLHAINKLALILGILLILSAIFNYIQAFSMATVSNNFAKKLRTNISNKINKLPLKYFDKHETGDILSRVTNDIDTIGMNMNQSLANLVSNVTLFIGSIIMMFVTNWIMALTGIFASLFGFMFMGLILGKSQKHFIQRQVELGDLNGYIEEIYSGHNIVKAYNGEEEAFLEFDKVNDRLYDCNKKSQFLSGIMQPIMMFVGNFGYVAVCIVGALLTMNHYTSFGTIVAFMLYVRLFTNPLSQIAQSMTSLQSTAAAGERVFEFLDEEELSKENHITKKLDKNTVKGNIEFKNVRFSYDPDRVIINDFSAKVSSGEKIAIVGPTGAGKTTMVNLLMKFYEIDSGDILIDGVSTKELTRENIHDLFVMVLQDTWLFEGTVADNIRFSKKDVTDEEIWNACKVVGIDHFIKTLPGGIKSILKDNDSISSGQKQLLTIARGMIENAPFLILDEATSNVDTRTEELVQKAMDKLTEGRTSFIIAHRLSTIKNADLILVMNEGNIVEQGNHDELMKLNGFYAELYNSQFKK